jgi:hypothetical protein
MEGVEQSISLEGVSLRVVVQRLRRARLMLSVQAYPPNKIGSDFF